MRPSSKFFPLTNEKPLRCKQAIKVAAGQNPNDINTSAIAKSMGLTQGALFRHLPARMQSGRLMLAAVLVTLLGLRVYVHLF